MVGEENLQRHLKRAENRKRGEQRERDRGERHEREHGGEREAAGHLRNAVFAASLRGKLREPFERVEIETHPGQQTHLLAS
jgi:hypothetical protein